MHVLSSLLYGTYKMLAQGYADEYKFIACQGIRTY